MWWREGGRVYLRHVVAAMLQLHHLATSIASLPAVLVRNVHELIQGLILRAATVVSGLLAILASLPAARGTHRPGGCIEGGRVDKRRAGRNGAVCAVLGFELFALLAELASALLAEMAPD